MPGNFGSSTITGAANDAPGMFVEAAAEHLAELRPGEERCGACVGCDEAFAIVVDEGEQVGLLLWSESNLAHAEEEDCVEIVEIFRVEQRLAVVTEDGLFSDELRIGVDEGVVLAGLVAQPLDGGDGVRDRIMLVAVADVCPRQDALAVGFGVAVVAVVSDGRGVQARPNAYALIAHPEVCRSLRIRGCGRRLRGLLGEYNHGEGRVQHQQRSLLPWQN